MKEECRELNKYMNNCWTSILQVTWSLVIINRQTCPDCRDSWAFQTFFLNRHTFLKTAIHSQHSCKQAGNTDWKIKFFSWIRWQTNIYSLMVSDYLKCIVGLDGKGVEGRDWDVGFLYPTITRWNIAQAVLGKVFKKIV